MSRLYDRVMANGCKPFRSDLFTSGYHRPDANEEEVPHASATATESLDPEEIADIPVFLLDDVAEYVTSKTRSGDDLLPPEIEQFFGVVRPPFDRCFLEFSAKPFGNPRGAIGWLVEVADAEDLAGDIPPEWRSARWSLDMKLVIENEPRSIYGVCVSLQHALDAEGLSARSAGKIIAGEFLPRLTRDLTADEKLLTFGLAHHFALPAFFGLSLINCKNVDVRVIDPPDRLSKKHSRKRGRPLTSYYVLDIQPMVRVLDTEGEANARGLGHALHICRGHFKTYTDDAPLFGRHTGTYWWESRVRGKAEQGVVEKDYRIRLDQGLGREYAEADEHPDIQPTALEHTGLDPDLGGRGLRAHNVTQNALAQAVREAGHEPRRPKPDEPQYDLAWEDGDTTWVAEVKSVTPQNEERQLRTALGQVLRYRQLLEADGRTVRAMIATEVEPSDPSWPDLCSREGIELVWGPDNLRLP